MGGGRRTALLLLAVAAAAAGQAAAEQFGDGAALCSAGALHDQANQGTVLCAATSKPTCAGTVKIDNAEDCCEHTPIPHTHAHHFTRPIWPERQSGLDSPSARVLSQNGHHRGLLWAPIRVIEPAAHRA